MHMGMDDRHLSQQQCGLTGGGRDADSRFQVVDVLPILGSLLLVGQVIGDHYADQLSELFLLARAVQLCVHLAMVNVNIRDRSLFYDNLKKTCL